MIGTEPTMQEHIDALVEVFSEVKRVLRPDGSLWLNYGDAYAGSNKGVGTKNWGKKQQTNKGTHDLKPTPKIEGLKAKNLMFLPARLAMALQEDGWWVRSEIIWWKQNAYPESVRDRPGSAHEKLFLITKSPKYYYDYIAVRVPGSPNTHARRKDGERKPKKGTEPNDNRTGTWKDIRTVEEQAAAGSNLRNVWKIPIYPFKEAHFATFPPKLVEPCIKAGTSEYGVCSQCGAPWRREIEKVTMRTLRWIPTCEHGDKYPIRPSIVLDPFSGSGTAGVVAMELGRDFIGIDINAEYCEMARNRLQEAENI